VDSNGKIWICFDGVFEKRENPAAMRLLMMRNPSDVTAVRNVLLKRFSGEWQEEAKEEKKNRAAEEEYRRAAKHNEEMFEMIDEISPLSLVGSVTWDWKAPGPDAETLTEMMAAGMVHIQSVGQTDGDFHAYVLSDSPLDDYQVEVAWRFCDRFSGYMLSQDDPWGSAEIFPVVVITERGDTCLT